MESNKEEVQVCLVSRQPMPNIIPALLSKPAKVILLTTQQEISTAENVCKVLKENRVECQIHKKLIEPYDLTSVSDQLKVIYNQYQSSKLTMNITGGTKLMAIAAYDFFKSIDSDVIYVDTPHNDLIIMSTGGEIQKKHFEIKISVSDYLQAHGISMQKKARHKSYYNEKFLRLVDKELMKFLEFSLDLRFRLPVSGEFSRHGFTIKIQTSEHFQEPGSGKAASNKSKNKRFFDLYHDGSAILEGQIEDLNYFVGFWLEDYVYYLLKSRIPDDMKRSCPVISKSGTDNEIDVILTKNGQLYLISCKSGKFSKQDLFELEGLRQLAGGTFGKAFVIVPPKNGNYPMVRNRAKQLGIEFMTILEMKEKIASGAII